ncbi:hypothetical protein SPRG_03263 [Saprolegnia parasitica CBS 223.65]|uniref:Uncharacterized protein n=1 Tax=Saprolegnia parasitica (strain CBS 223.65) TaxID=695850 RepID=A0A067CS19_SAPPC|nr:hypothetical protein SPRG_03263 [Saprolegnia parasitica CBS 223.65]KDO32045.1 hypothetical protein SPRG_03263 [Saprolegnia parasitica CBS 223.65]|eukprot:XP_012197233.1 hypothetical protein SPRG_03263 [Saprolegnia parasitica CBS 223.65]
MSTTASAPSQLFCEFANVTFPSTVDNGAYRVSVKTDKTQTKMVLWLESKKTKLQWQCAIDDFSKHMETTYALPNAVVLAAIKNGLAAIDGAASKMVDAATKPSVAPASTINLCAKKASLALALEIKMSPEWTAGYRFEMTSIEVKVVDILEARIRDLEEAKAAPRMGFCTLTTTACYATNTFTPCTWTASTASTLLRVEKNTNIIVLQPGLYHVHCNLTLASVPSASLTLRINDAAAKTSSYSGHASYITSKQLDLVHVTYLDAGASLTLCASMNQGSANGSMTIILLDRGTA